MWPSFEVAMMARLPYTHLRDGIFAHPTLAEALNSLFAAIGPGPVRAAECGAFVVESTVIANIFVAYGVLPMAERAATC